MAQICTPIKGATKVIERITDKVTMARWSSEPQTTVGYCTKLASPFG